MEKHPVSQQYAMYQEEDHETWQQLMKRQKQLHQGKVSQEYLAGFNLLELDEDRIINIEEVSSRLEGISGWTLVPVTGLIPTRDFFYMLINKKYPVNISIRKPWELDFSEQPDIFHDVCGHLPLLTNENFVRFLTTYSIIALKYVNNERAIDFLGRLYWYTYEMGLIQEGTEHKPYGGAIITSAEEIANVYSNEIPKYGFELGKIFLTPYNPYRLQNEYFVINSFDQLFNSLEQLEAKLIEYLLLPGQDYTIRNYPLNSKIGKGFNNVIGFLNEMQFRFPDAISFVAGQPDENFFDIENQLGKFQLYVDHVMQITGDTRKHTVNRIGQYGKTKGIVNDIVAEYLKKDENITVKPDNILITVGAQEAFSIIVSTICDREKDVILVENPSYIGISSFSEIFNYNIQGVQINEEGIDLHELKKKIIQVNRTGKHVKLVYVIPDFQNPSGACMPIGNRLKLMELARQYNFLVIEDSVYNSFTYAQQRHPTLKSLDRYNRVIYVGSFSKSLFPGLRIGLIAADQQVENEMGETTFLIDQMAKVKAQLTNNTSTISQAILGGVLLELNYSLHEYGKPKFESYRLKRNCMIGAMEKYIQSNTWGTGIQWTTPDGGFFIKLTVPFIVDDDCVFECAEKFGVIFCPMQYFYLKGGGEHEIRLTFSNLSLTDIEAGVKRLAAFFEYKTAAMEKKMSHGINQDYTIQS